jgi:Na+-translocating ferredoxin:NAD+ oxidoreductase subunit B
MSDAAESVSIVDRIEALLPQTQCTKCGQAGCRPYAEAIASGSADINQCPPGGQAGIDLLAVLLGRASKPLNPVHGVERGLMKAVIQEDLCIGCTLCIAACPVDAIIGAPKRMHTVLASACTGCDLCLPPCPTDCIRMVAVEPARGWTAADAHTARARFDAHQKRTGRGTAQVPLRESGQSDGAEDAKRKSVIAAALDRARSRRLQDSSP